MKIDYVPRNISGFKENEGKLGKLQEYKVLLDSKTGEMKFPKQIRELASFKGKQSSAHWREAHLVRIENHFKIKGADLDSPVASAVVNKTLAVLNAETQKKEIEKLPGWSGFLTAIQAEEKLRKQAVGTYLIRHSDDVSGMIDQMKQKYDCEIHPFFLVSVGEEKKFSEVLILSLPWGWIRYQDEPDLQSSSYTLFPNPKKLIESLMIAKFPLENKS